MLTVTNWQMNPNAAHPESMPFLTCSTLFSFGCAKVGGYIDQPKTGFALFTSFLNWENIRGTGHQAQNWAPA